MAKMRTESSLLLRICRLSVSRSDGRSYREEKKKIIGQTLPRPRVKMTLYKREGGRGLWRMSACVVCLTPQDALRENKIKARGHSSARYNEHIPERAWWSEDTMSHSRSPAVNLQYLWQRLDRSRDAVHRYNTAQRHNHAAEANKRNREQGGKKIRGEI